jgi:hypothetical protein
MARLSSFALLSTSEPRGLTLPSRGCPKGCAFRAPLMSNVRQALGNCPAIHWTQDRYMSLTPRTLRISGLSRPSLVADSQTGCARRPNTVQTFETIHLPYRRSHNAHCGCYP